MRAVLGCAAIAVLASSVSGAVTLGNFAGGVAETGWGRWSGGVQALDSAVYTVTDLDTSGDGGALETNIAGFSDSFGYSFSTAGKVADFYAHDLLIFDLIYRGTPTNPNDGGFSQVFQVILQSSYNSNNLQAFQQNYNDGSPVALSSFGAGGSSAGWAAGSSSMQTRVSMTIDYRAWRDSHGGTEPGYLQMWMSTNDSNRRFKAIDNVRLAVVPEPTTLAAVAGLGVLALRRRAR